MGFTGSIIAACIGLINLRMALDYTNIANHQKLFMTTALVAAFALFFPLLSFGLNGGGMLIGMTVIFLFPYKQALIWALKRSARNGVRKLSRSVKGKYLYNQESEFFTLSYISNDHKIWVGNVHNKLGSLDKHITAESSYSMLAFVYRLNQPKFLNCSILKGWAVSRYHNEEYRSRTRLLQGSFALAIENQHSTQERITKGQSENLHDHYDPKDHQQHENSRYKIFSRVLSDNKEEFETLFSGELYDALINCASHSQYYELNITPTSINIYTTLCNYEVQKFNMELLMALGAALENKKYSKNGDLSSTPYTQDAAA